MYTNAAMQDDSLRAPAPADYAFSEEELSNKFCKGLWRKYGMRLDDLKDWQYAGGDDTTPSYHAEFRRKFRIRCRWPARDIRCVCDTPIIHNFYVANRERTIVLVTGGCCVDRFLGKNRKRCELCYEPHRNRKRNMCAACMKIAVCKTCNADIDENDPIDKRLCRDCWCEEMRAENERLEYEHAMAKYEASLARIAAKRAAAIEKITGVAYVEAKKIKWCECPKCKMIRRKEGYRLCYKCQFGR